MYLSALSLTNFRNYRSAALSLAQGLTIFTGPNGAGKSNILEAIHCLATGRSFRARSDAEMRSFALIRSAPTHGWPEKLGPGIMKHR